MLSFLCGNSYAAIKTMATTRAVYIQFHSAEAFCAARHQLTACARDVGDGSYELASGVLVCSSSFDFLKPHEITPTAPVLAVDSLPPDANPKHLLRSTDRAKVVWVSPPSQGCTRYLVFRSADDAATALLHAPGTKYRDHASPRGVNSSGRQWPATLGAELESGARLRQCGQFEFGSKYVPSTITASSLTSALRTLVDTLVSAEPHQECKMATSPPPSPPPSPPSPTLPSSSFPTAPSSPPSPPLSPPTPASPTSPTSYTPCTHASVFSIDGSGTAFRDDALHLEPIGFGLCKVSVHIADVALVVKPGSLLDIEARARGCSAYTLGGVRHMLPAHVADACSLSEGVERPAVTVSFVLREGSKTVNLDELVHSMYVNRSLVCNSCALSYAQADSMLTDGAAASDGIPGCVAEGVRLLDNLLGAQVDVPLPRLKTCDAEAAHGLRFVIDDAGLPSVVLTPPRSRSRALIERLMQITNACVARRLAAAPCLTGSALMRRHSGCGRAEYACAADGDCAAHAEFGVYTHFTSPIRRYADLVVHRQLLATVDGAGAGAARGMAMQAVAECAVACNEAQRRGRYASEQAQRAVAVAYCRLQTGGR